MRIVIQPSGTSRVSVRAERSSPDEILIRLERGCDDLAKAETIILLVVDARDLAIALISAADTVKPWQVSRKPTPGTFTRKARSRRQTLYVEHSTDTSERRKG